MHQLEIKVLNITDARCNREVYCLCLVCREDELPEVWKKLELLTSLSKAPQFPKQHCHLEGFQASAVVLSVKTTCRRRSVRGIVGITPTKETRSTRKKTFSNATLSTTNPTWSGLESSPGLLRQKPATNGLSHGYALKTETYLNNIRKFSLYRAENTWPLH